MAGLDKPVVHTDARVLIAPKGAVVAEDVRVHPSQIEAADLILTEDGRVLKSRWTTRGW